MKVNKKQFNRIFKDMEVKTATPWRTTTCVFTHNDKRKEANKKVCRKKVLC